MYQEITNDVIIKNLSKFIWEKIESNIKAGYLTSFHKSDHYIGREDEIIFILL